MAWILVHYAPKESRLYASSQKAFPCCPAGTYLRVRKRAHYRRKHRLLFQPVPVAAVGFPFARAGWIAPHVARLEKVMISNLQ